MNAWIRRTALSAVPAKGGHVWAVATSELNRVPRPEEPVRRLADLFRRGDVLVLTGAGVSTDSGIPDYRDERGEWKRRKPIELREFLGSESARRRYWARSFLGFEQLLGARPNAAHHALATFERAGLVPLLVTQNVDGLHQAAGSRQVVDLHGRIDAVVCLACRAALRRQELQVKLRESNQTWAARDAVIAPDGDADPGDAEYESFRLVACECGGVLKPDVVFFGETVPKERVERSMDALSRARALVIVGSSLMVFSGFRFARAAARQGTPIIVVNRGTTRADPLCAFKVEGNAGDVLGEIAAEL